MHKYKDISIFKLESDEPRAELDMFEIENFDLSDEWSVLKNNYDIEKLYCVLYFRG